MISMCDIISGLCKNPENIGNLKLKDGKEFTVTFVECDKDWVHVYVEDLPSYNFLTIAMSEIAYFTHAWRVDDTLYSRDGSLEVAPPLDVFGREHKSTSALDAMAASLR